MRKTQVAGFENIVIFTILILAFSMVLPKLLEAKNIATKGTNIQSAKLMLDTLSNDIEAVYLYGPNNTIIRKFYTTADMVITQTPDGKNLTIQVEGQNLTQKVRAKFEVRPRFIRVNNTIQIILESKYGSIFDPMGGSVDGVLVSLVEGEE